jgi:hypothetical protein
VLSLLEPAAFRDFTPPVTNTWLRRQDYNTTFQGLATLPGTAEAPPINHMNTTPHKTGSGCSACLQTQQQKSWDVVAHGHGWKYCPGNKWEGKEQGMDKIQFLSLAAL